MRQRYAGAAERVRPSSRTETKIEWYAWLLDDRVAQDLTGERCVVQLVPC
jgi:hypothetical protein